MDAILQQFGPLVVLIGGLLALASVFAFVFWIGALIASAFDIGSVLASLGIGILATSMLLVLLFLLTCFVKWA